MTNLSQAVQEYAARFNTEIVKLFVLPEGPEKRVPEAMKYAVMNGGKRLRPFLIYQTAHLFGKTFEETFQAAASLEMLHTYSLIHDDLPAMDNDDLRRGKPTCHKQFDEATAILAGDGLLTYAFELLAHSDYDLKTKVSLLKMLSRASNAYDGMIAGQTLDLFAEQNHDVSDPQKLILKTEEMKTARLLRYACQAGAVIGGASSQQYDDLGAYADKIGIAFQIKDDLLDLFGDQARMGKTLKKDVAQNKLTFVSCWGVEKAEKYAQNLIDEAQELLAPFGDKADILRAFARFIIDRDH